MKPRVRRPRRQNTAIRFDLAWDGTMPAAFGCSTEEPDLPASGRVAMATNAGQLVLRGAHLEFTRTSHGLSVTARGGKWVRQ